MEEQVENVKKPNDRKTSESLLERIPITKESSAKIQRWIEQIRSGRPGITITKRDFINWYFDQQAEILIPAMEKQAASHFYDEIKFLQTTLEDLKRAKAEGKSIDVRRLIENLPSMSSAKESKKQASRRSIKQKTDSLKSEGDAKKETATEQISALKDEGNVPYVGT